MLPQKIFIVALLATSPAAAQRPPERPEPSPRMDVQVTYATTQPEARDAPPGETRIAFHAGTGVFRIDPPAAEGLSVHILSQRGTDRAVMVMQSRRAWLELEPGTTMLRELEVALASGRATRQGTARFANIPCTVWQLPEPALGVACISQRGVLLRREGPSGAVLEATAIDLRPQPAERFVPPDGYRAITLDEMLAVQR
jgi:hypothetical protein